jgi:hypothetical protein
MPRQFKRIRNIIQCKRWSFVLEEFSTSATVASAGQELLLRGRVKNNGLRLGTVYVVLRMPEVKPYEFQFYWKPRTPSQRAAFNEYRKKFGLPEVATDR